MKTYTVNVSVNIELEAEDRATARAEAIEEVIDLVKQGRGDEIFVAHVE